MSDISDFLKKRCYSCNGDGIIVNKYQCFKCVGTGRRLDRGYDGHTVELRCLECGGRGEIEEEKKCHSCGGLGWTY